MCVCVYCTLTLAGLRQVAKDLAREKVSRTQGSSGPGVRTDKARYHLAPRLPFVAQAAKEIWEKVKLQFILRSQHTRTHFSYCVGRSQICGERCGDADCGDWRGRTQGPGYRVLEREEDMSLHAL
jgi:hypothetical protein